MAKPPLSLTVLGVGQMDRQFSRFEDVVSDYTEPLRGVSELFRKIEEEQFRSSGHGRWKPLSARTMARKKGPGILRESDALFESLTRPGGDYAEHISKTEGRFGTLVPYGIFHQLGTSRMPARPPIDLREEDKRAITRLIQRYIVDEARKQGLLSFGGV